MSLDVAILMTTYNGEEFISDQIKSIQKQTETNWRLYIRDDGSTDNTVLIVKEMACNDSRIKIFEDKNGNMGVKHGFMFLLKKVSAEYYFFSDQDDVWLPNKISETIKKFEIHTRYEPVLVHTNLSTVDKNLKVLKKEFYPTSKKIDKLNIILSSNSVTGCTVAINDELKQRIKNDLPEFMIMHDWWMGLCAVSFGCIEYVNAPMIFYRQHSTNLVGTDTTLIGRLKKIFSYENELKKINQALNQAENLFKIHGFEMTKDKSEIVDQYVKLLEKNRFFRILILLRYGFKKCSVMGTLSLWWGILEQPKRKM